MFLNQLQVYGYGTEEDVRLDLQKFAGANLCTTGGRAAGNQNHRFVYFFSSYKMTW